MPDRLDAATLRRAMEIFTESLREHRQELNSLNVYPVPDGDTGTNLLMTQEAVVSALSRLDKPEDMPAMGAAISRASLMGARGNSGVILSQILRGMCEESPPEGAFGPRELADALDRAAREAHRAVARPVQGTILSVIRDAAGAAAESARGEDIGCLAVVEAALEEARASLGRTRELLPELRQAGVVDAGGKGIVLLLDSLRAALAGERLSEPIGPRGPVGQAGDPADAAELQFAFEVQYLLEAPDEAMAALRRALAGLGDSLVVVGGNGLFNVHVHTNDPGKAVEIGEEAGRPADVQIANLAEQVVSCIGGQARAVRVAEQASALVAVAEGDGLVEAFASLGALVVRGGPGNNPSVGELAEAIEAAPADAVILLPNHANAVPATEQAAAQTTKEVRVIKSPSIPSGLAAATAFNPMVEPGKNLPAMEEAVQACGWGEMARAERDATTPAGPVPRGGWIGAARGEVVSVGGAAADCARRIVQGLAGDDGELITLVAGTAASAEDRKAVEEEMRRAFPALDVQMLDGGQPRYAFLIGVE
jgi:fatty acid kinase